MINFYILNCELLSNHFVSESAVESFLHSINLVAKLAEIPKDKTHVSQMILVNSMYTDAIYVRVQNQFEPV